VYAPDYIVNAGGIIVTAQSPTPGGFNRQRAMEQVTLIYQMMRKVLAIAKDQQIPTYRAADIVAEQRIVMIRQVKHVTAGSKQGEAYYAATYR
jgi:leucine dehydrogenase